MGAQPLNTSFIPEPSKQSWQSRVQPHPAVRVLSSAEISTINISGMGELAGFIPSWESIAALGYSFDNL